MHFKNIDDPLQFDELWRAAGVSKSLAQNWTNGRPLRLKPYFSQGQGKGSRSLYAVVDAYLLAFLNLLRNNGVAPVPLMLVLGGFNADMEFRVRTLSEEFEWVAVTLRNGQASVGGLLYDPREGPNSKFDPVPLSERDEVVTQILVNTKRLRSVVDRRLQEIAKLKSRGK